MAHWHKSTRTGKCTNVPISSRSNSAHKTQAERRGERKKSTQQHDKRKQKRGTERSRREKKCNENSSERAYTQTKRKYMAIISTIWFTVTTYSILGSCSVLLLFAVLCLYRQIYVHWKSIGVDKCKHQPKNRHTTEIKSLLMNDENKKSSQKRHSIQ